MKRIFQMAGIACLFLILPSVKAQVNLETDSTGGVLLSDKHGEAVMSLTPSDTNKNSFSMGIAGYTVIINGEKDTTKTSLTTVLNTLSDYFSDTTRKNNKKKPKPYYESHIGFFEVGVNGFTPTNYSLYAPTQEDFLSLGGNSMNFTFNIWDFGIALTKKKTIGLSAAIGISTRDYVLDNNISLKKENDMIVPYFDTNSSYTKSKINVFSLHVPVTIDFNIAKKYFIALGAYGDMVLSSHTKTKYPKTKTYNPYINTFQFGLTGRIGINNRAYLFGNYEITEFFKTNKGPATHAFSLGIGFDL